MHRRCTKLLGFCLSGFWNGVWGLGAMGRRVWGLGFRDNFGFLGLGFGVSVEDLGFSRRSFYSRYLK